MQLSRGQTHHQYGFSLIELLVTLVVGGIVIALVGQMLYQVRALESWAQAQARTQMLVNELTANLSNSANCPLLFGPQTFSKTAGSIRQVNIYSVNNPAVIYLHADPIQTENLIGGIWQVQGITVTTSYNEAALTNTFPVTLQFKTALVQGASSAHLPSAVQAWNIPLLMQTSAAGVVAQCSTNSPYVPSINVGTSSNPQAQTFFTANTGGNCQPGQSMTSAMIGSLNNQIGLGCTRLPPPP